MNSFFVGFLKRSLSLNLHEGILGFEIYLLSIVQIVGLYDGKIPCAFHYVSLSDINDIPGRGIKSVIFTASDSFTGTSTIFSCCSYGSVLESNMYLLGQGQRKGILAQNNLN